MSRNNYLITVSVFIFIGKSPKETISENTGSKLRWNNVLERIKETIVSRIRGGGILRETRYPMMPQMLSVIPICQLN